MAQWGTLIGKIKPQGNLQGVISIKVEKVESQSKEIAITENGTGFQITGSVSIGFYDSSHPAGTGEAANLSKITAERRRINVKPDARKRHDNT